MSTRSGLAGHFGERDRASVHARLLEEERQRRRQVHVRVWVIRVSALVIVLTAWEWAAVARIVNVVDVSHPIGIARYLFRIFATGEIWPHIKATTYAAILGLVIGSSLGILAGALLDIIPTASKAFDPYIVILNSMPRPALAPVFLLWFGFGVVPKLLIAASITFFVMLLTTRAGLQTIDRDVLMMMRVIGMNRRQEFLKVKLLNATPAIIAGLRLGAVYSVLGVVVTEMIASQKGLGQLIVFETGRFNTDGAFAIIALLSFIATCFDLGISFVQRRVRWTVSE